MIIADFTEFELEFFRQNCNFVGNEKLVFELRGKGVPLELIAEQVNLSVDGAKRISKKVNNKIKRTLSHF